jgi:competence protein ComEA
VPKGGFDTTATRRREDGRQGSFAALFRRFRPQILVSVLVVVVLAGGALYASRLSEKAPRVVYSASLQEVAAEAGEPLLVNINTADVEELDELPGVGPATAEEIIQYRRGNGPFRSLDELEEVKGIGPKTLQKIKPFAEV